jgi:autotransporter-associated beta strand protein
MVGEHRRAAVLCAAIVALTVLAPRSEAQFATEIAITGTVVPGTGGNAFISFNTPVINNVGQVAFLGQFSGGQGIFSVTGNYFQGSTPQASPNATFPQIPMLNAILLSGFLPPGGAGNGPTFTTFNAQVPLNNTASMTASNNMLGQVAALGNLSDGSSGIFGDPVPGPYPTAASQSNPVTIAATGNLAAGTTSFVYNTFGPPALNDNNALAFQTVLSPAGFQAIYVASVTNGTTPPLLLVAATNGTVPGGGDTFATFDKSVALSSITDPPSANHIAFQASLNSGNSAIFSGDVGPGVPLTNIAQTGTASPVPGFVFASFADPVTLSGNGQVAFQANLTSGASGASLASAIFAGMPGGTLFKVASTTDSMGAALPSGYSATFPLGAKYFAPFGSIAQSGDNQVGFSATLSAGGAGAILLWKNSVPGAVTHVAVSGDVAPGTGGATYAGFYDQNSPTPLDINDHQGPNGSHELAFLASLAGPGVNGTNNVGLFLANDQLVPAGSPNQTLNETETSLLARTGESITVSPGVKQIIANFGAAGSGVSTAFATRTGNGSNSLNDLGELTTTVVFQDGGQGVFVFAPVLHLSPFSVTSTSSPINWGDVGTAGRTAWTFSYSPANQVYPLVIDPGDVGLSTIIVKGPGKSQAIPSLQVGGLGVAHLQLASGNGTDGNPIVLQLGGGAISSGTNVLTIKGPSDITGPLGVIGGALQLFGDVSSVAGTGTATIAADIDLDGDPNTNVGAFRTFTVARGNFVGSNPIDLLVSGVISGTRGLIKAGDGTMVLTGLNTYTGPTIVTGGMLSLVGDAELGTAPTTPSPGMIVLNGDGLQFTGTTTINANRGIALGPVTGFGGGTFNVTGANVLTYGGIIADNTDGTTTGVGGLTKTGTGTLVLSGLSNTYRGGTIVTQGTLLAATDGSLGADGTPVTVNTGATLNYTGAGIAANVPVITDRTFTLNGGTLSVSSAFTTARPLIFNNSTVSGGTLAGPGVFATAVGGSTTFVNTAIAQNATLTLNGTDTVINVSQSGQLNVGAKAGPVTMNGVINQGSGSMTLGANSITDVANFQSYGTLTLNPSTIAGQFTLLMNTGTTPLFFNGGSRTFIATPQTAGSQAAAFDLNGQNAIVAGGLFVNNGIVADSSSAGTATIVADFGALVKGAGFYQNAIITQNGGKVQAGNSPGVASFGKFVFGPGGVSNYVFAIDDADGAAGPKPDVLGHVSGWGLINAVQHFAGFAPTSGDFTWTATPTTRLTVALDTLVNPTTVGTDVPGLMADFDPSQSYVWPAVRWSGTYSGPTDPATLTADTSFDTSGFLNPVAGTFGWNLDPANQTLSLTYTPSAVPEPGTLALVGLAAAAGWRWRRRQIK